jgi:thiamine biosynthesis protein ThiI
MERTILVRYGEIHLKGLNRPFFERALMNNLRDALRPFVGARVERRDGRVYVEGVAPEDEKAAVDRLCRVFGVHSVSRVVGVDKGLDSIAAAALDLIREAAKEAPATFKVRARRSDKRFPLNSMELAAEIGGRALKALPYLKVDVHRPQIMLDIEVRERAYLYTDAKKAVGGMPVGTGGRAMLLLSGGIDSPVAGYMIARRGVAVDCVHFESVPYTSGQARQKVIDLATIMAGYCGPMRLHIVSFTEIQQKLYEDGPPPLLTILMRRFMMRIAERLAKKRRCGALITGENLGQVASQTMDSLNATNAVVSIPVFRPLIGFDKAGIMDRARQIGTYETSILPYDDCCSVFVPRHPATRPRPGEPEKAEAKMDVDAMVEAALSGVETLDIRPAENEW